MARHTARASRPARPPAVTFDAFAVAAPGLEELVAQELAGLGIAPVSAVEGGVEFPATAGQLYAANLRLRTASRVLVRLAAFRALSFADLERRAKRIPWERVLAPGQRVILRVTCRKSRLYHSDAVGERLLRDLQQRAGVAGTVGPRAVDDTAGNEDQDAQLVVVRLDHDQCTVSADSSGAHLHQRGYRTAVTPAPMRETLAAAMLLASGWDRQSPLIDPFCGSGTIPIEAALLAQDLPPGRNRRFRFMEWPGFYEGTWRRVVAEPPVSAGPPVNPLIVGSDRSVAAIKAAVANAERAGVSRGVHFEKRDATALAPPGGGPGWIVCNPPYGVRLGDTQETRRLLAAFGAALRERFAGWHVSILAQDAADRAMGIPLRPVLATTNGGLRVRVLQGVVPETPGR
jgi:putative N6-adenine-specific DNA methylase